MVGKVNAARFGPFVVALSLVWLAGLTAVMLWPASWWFEVYAVRVSDSQAGQPVRMVVERAIHRPFTGSWSVAVRKVDGDVTRIACVANGDTDYRPDAALPDDLTLGWWTNGACVALPSGHYIATTSWRIYPTIAPVKTVTASSNIFKVAP